MGLDNIVVINKGLHPLVNFNFMLRVEGIYDVPCKKVEQFEREYEYEYLQEGGLNDYVHLKRKPASEPFFFEVERYVGTDYIDPLPNGAELLLPILLFVSRSAGNFFPAHRTYAFTGCTVMKKTYGELNAEEGGILTERIKIAYREMLCVDIPIGV